MQHDILTINNQQPGAFNGEDIINALIHGFENQLEFSLLQTVLYDCPQYEQSQKDAFLSMLSGINKWFYRQDMYNHDVMIDNDMVYDLDTETGIIPGYELEAQGYKYICFTIACGEKVPELNMGADVHMPIRFYYLVENSNLIKLTCSRKVMQ